MKENKGLGHWIVANHRAFLLGFLIALTYHLTIVPWAWSRPTLQTSIFPLSMVSVFPGIVATAPVAIGVRVYCESSTGYIDCQDSKAASECYEAAKASTACTEPGLAFSRMLSIVLNFIFLWFATSGTLYLIGKKKNRTE